MKKWIPLLFVAVILCGCTGKNEALPRAMALRSELLAKNVSFDAEITADYGNVCYQFSMQCQAQTDGTMTFSVLAPESIQGITGSVSGSGGKLTFDDSALAFDLMADGLITPVSAPWVMMKALRGGYLSGCGFEEEKVRISVDDSYAEDALHLEVWLDGQDRPAVAEIYWQGRRLLTLNVTNFSMQ